MKLNEAFTYKKFTTLTPSKEQYKCEDRLKGPGGYLPQTFDFHKSVISNGNGEARARLVMSGEQW